LLNHQNNYVEHLNINDKAAKTVNILVQFENVLCNYFDDPNKLFSDLYLAKFLDISAKLFFPCIFGKYVLRTRVQNLDAKSTCITLPSYSSNPSIVRTYKLQRDHCFSRRSSKY